MLASADHVDVIAAGKAAGGMLRAVGDRPPRGLRRILGIGDGGPPAPLPASTAWVTAGHPVPDARSVEAAVRALEIARSGGERDALLVLLSGGGSALMALPAPGLALADKQRTVQALLVRGADIHELNAVRKHISAIKGGRLAAATRARTITLAISDVTGDDLSVIASGPTVPDASTFATALEVLDRRGGRAGYPEPVVRHLQRGAAGREPETPKAWDGCPPATAHVIGNLTTALDGASAGAAALGYEVHVIHRRLTGQARVAGGALADALAGVPRTGRRLCVIGGGETTVEVRGTGRGGRNQELALALALRLEAIGGEVAALSAGTDGVDGPTDAAGAIVDTSTVARARATGMDPLGYLDNNDSYSFFARLGDLVQTGPTGTNVGDIQIVLVGGW